MINRSLIKINGLDQTTFLQKLVTSDLTKLQPNIISPSSLLSPQGKILFSFLLMLLDDAIYIDIHSKFAEDLANRLNLYRLNANISLDIYKNINVNITNTIEPNSFQDKRFTPPLYRSYFKQFKADNAINYDQICIENGIARFAFDFEPNTYFPHDLNYDFLNIVSFTKGCFIGQEVVARMQHKATLKKRTLIVKAEHKIQTGDSIYANNKIAGATGNVVDNQALAVIRLDYLKHAIITCNNNPIELINPAYLPL